MRNNVKALPVDGKDLWDDALITWLLTLADQGCILETDRAAVRVTARDDDLLGCASLLQYWRDVRHWAPETFPQRLAVTWPGMSIHTGIRYLAQAWAHCHGG